MIGRAAGSGAPAKARKRRYKEKHHAPGKIRTCDLCLRRAALYPLSYGRAGAKCSPPQERPTGRVSSAK